MPELRIRRAEPSDAQVLTDLGQTCYTETFGHLYPPEDLETFLAASYSLERVRRDLADPGSAMWVVEDGARAVGYALAGRCDLPHPDVTPACGELKRFYLRRAHQNSGAGGRLFAQVMDWLQSGGPRDLWIGVWSENHGAIRFYARHGFAHVGEYGFVVGRTVDREWILRRPADARAG